MTTLILALLMMLSTFTSAAPVNLDDPNLLSELPVSVEARDLRKEAMDKECFHNAVRHGLIIDPSSNMFHNYTCLEVRQYLKGEKVYDASNR